MFFLSIGRYILFAVVIFSSLNLRFSHLSLLLRQSDYDYVFSQRHHSILVSLYLKM